MAKRSRMGERFAKPIAFATLIPGWSEGPDPESRDSGFVLRTRRNDALGDGFRCAQPILRSDPAARFDLDRDVAQAAQALEAALVGRRRQRIVGDDRDDRGAMAGPDLPKVQVGHLVAF